jgi:endonuclease/exonuclease/phosphatase family metal-dependent hydrolase
MNEISAICLNIECDRHIPKIWKLLSDQPAEVILLQEIFKDDITKFEDHLSMPCYFSGLTYLQCDRGTPEMGIATFTNLKIVTSSVVYYRGQADKLPCITTTEPEKMARPLLITELSNGSDEFCFINTHFTWSANATPSEQQFIDYHKMVETLDSIPEFVLCGDFNAPRGTAIFNLLASKYKDNIPQDIKTTLDRKLHKAGNLDLVVDGLFTTPKYQTSIVEVISGVSDHCALRFKISKL